MQFHKHLVPGFQKRFGYRLGHFDGIYNETRESISKGTYVSLGEFIAMPLRNTTNLMIVTNFKLFVLFKELLKVMQIL